MKTIRPFRIDLEEQTLLFSSFKNRLPELVYWGRRLDDEENLHSLIANQEDFIPQCFLEESPRISIAPESAWAFTGYPGLELLDDGGKKILAAFSLEKFVKRGGKKEIHFQFISKLESGKLQLRLVAEYHWDKNSGLLEARHCLQNLGGGEVGVHWLAAPVFSLPEKIKTGITWGGKWIKEFQRQEFQWDHDIILRENRRGRTSHEQFPGFVFPHPGSTETIGEAHAFHLGWSGNHRSVVETLTTGKKQFQMGAITEPGEVILLPGENFTTPPLYAAFSVSGINGIRTAFHGYIRQRLLHPKKSPRKVIANSWEAVYFDHEIDKLEKWVKMAKQCGVERVVLDDGWFQNRVDDTTSLGDWEVDKKKYPNDLTPLINQAHGLELDFGLWLEPEMVSPNSDLANDHPDWILGKELMGSEYPHLIQGRNQWVLDISNAEVWDYLYKKIASLIKKYQLAYIKWDHNRNLQTPYSYHQTLAVYRLWAALKKRHPILEIESCASGGARIDMGMLRVADRFWLSDSNDPLERWRMQVEASTFFPPEVLGSHVGPEQCHTSGRVTSLDFRLWVATSCHFGLELDVSELPESEKNRIGQQSRFYQDNRHWLHQADCLRIAGNGVDGLAYISPKQERWLLFLGCLESIDNQGSPLVKLPFPLKGKEYRIRLVELGEKQKKKSERPSQVLIQDKDRDFFSGWIQSGKSLYQVGFRIPPSFPLTMWVLEGKQIRSE